MASKPGAIRRLASRLILGFLICLCTGCAQADTAIPTEPFAHFSATENIPFDFDYPAGWQLIQDDRILPSILFFDPAGQTPIPEPGSLDLRGVFEIVQWDVVPGIPLEEYAAQQIDRLTGPSGARLIAQETVTIDQIPAVRLILAGSQAAQTGYLTEMQFLYTGGYVYKIRLSILEAEREGKFAQAVDELMRSMTILPPSP